MAKFLFKFDQLFNPLEFTSLLRIPVKPNGVEPPETGQRKRVFSMPLLRDPAHERKVFQKEDNATFPFHNSAFLLHNSSTTPFNQIHIFAGLKPETLAFLEELAEAVACPEGHIIVREGELSNAFYVLEDGSVEIVKHLDSSKPVVLAVLEAGDFFGEMSFLECRPRSASVRCQKAARLHCIRSTDLLRLFHHDPGQYAIIILNIARDLSRRLHALDEAFVSRTSL